MNAMRGLAALPVDMHLAARNGFDRQCAGLEEAGGPQPLVEANPIQLIAMSRQGMVIIHHGSLICSRPDSSDRLKAAARTRLLIGQRDIEFQDFIAAFTIQMNLDLTLIDRHIFTHHLKQFLLERRQIIGTAPAAASLMGDDDL
jgi:hypothetical protein